MKHVIKSNKNVYSLTPEQTVVDYVLYYIEHQFEEFCNIRNADPKKFCLKLHNSGLNSVTIQILKLNGYMITEIRNSNYVWITTNPSFFD